MPGTKKSVTHYKDSKYLYCSLILVLLNISVVFDEVHTYISKN